MGLLQRLGTSVRSWVSVGSAPPRDPVIAEWFGGGAETNSGVVVTPDNARECPEVDACISLNEDTIATIPLDLFERKSEDEWVRAVGHPLHDLLHDRPNSWQTAPEFRQMMEGYRETHGNAYARIIAAGGFPTALEPAHPAEMRPFRTPTGGVAYRWYPPGEGSSRVLLQDEVLHLRWSPAKRSNLLEGQSPVERHRETIGRALATMRYLSLYFRNNATPKIKIVVPGNLNDDQVEKLRDQFMRLHGQGNMHKPMVAHSGLNAEPIGARNDEAQVVQIYEQVTGQLARIWDVPLHLIGETAKSTSWGTGIEQQSIGFVVYAMRSKTVVWEKALNKALMSRETARRFKFEFNIDGLMRGDFKSRMDGYGLMIQWGLASPNEVRRLMNLPPVAGGEERLTPLNMVPASRIMDVLLRTGSTPATRMIEFDDATRLLAEIIPLMQTRQLNGKGGHA